MLFWPIIGLFALMMKYFLLKHFQDVDVCYSKEKLNRAYYKLNSIVDAIPKCIYVLSEKFELVFFNSTLKNLLQEDNLIEYLKMNKYYMRYQQSNNSNQIVDDIKNSLLLDIGCRVTYGITDNHGILIE